jgi:hypothetical protein
LNNYILYLTKNNTYSKIYPLVISSILAFAVFAGIPNVFENITAQEDDASITQGGDKEVNQSKGNDSEMVQGQSNIAKNDGNNEEEEGDDE